MNVELVEEDRKDNELFFSIFDKDTGNIVGILFTVGDHVAYEVFEMYRNQGAATQALRSITSKMNRPLLDIRKDNIYSIRTAKRVGYKLIETGGPFELYAYDNERKLK